MSPAGTSTTREARWLRGRLRSLSPSLPVHNDSGQGRARHIVFQRQGGTDIVNISGTVLVRSAWLVYISEPVDTGETAYIEDLEADADRMHDAIYKPYEVNAVNGRYIEECRRDYEHSTPVYDEDGQLAELQLGGVYLVFTSKVPGS